LNLADQSHILNFIIRTEYI